MPQDFHSEESNDEWFDEEYSDDFDDDPTETVSCPQCGSEVYEDAVQCPACGAYITFHATVWSGRPLWWIILGLLGLVAAILTLGGFSVW